MWAANVMRYFLLLYRQTPRRYRSLYQSIFRSKSLRILEIGVFDGNQALRMIRTASIRSRPCDIEYFGFDLFEGMDEVLLQKEASKQPLSRPAIQEKLDKTGANISLFEGDTKVTLPLAVEKIGEVDFVFIDGGHSVETIASDWRCIERVMGVNTLVVFDDYYPDKTGILDDLGCNSIIDDIDRSRYDVKVLSPEDSFNKDWGRLKIRMVLVQKRS
jgi:hypothetical protein